MKTVEFFTGQNGLIRRVAVITKLDRINEKFLIFKTLHDLAFQYFIPRVFIGLLRVSLSTFTTAYEQFSGTTYSLVSEYKTCY